MKMDYLMGSVLGGVTLLIGGWDKALQVLLILMAVDVLTGLLKGIYKAEFSSRAFREGLVSKSGFMLILILAFQLDTVMGNKEPYIRTVVNIFYIGIEGTSIIENLGMLGVKIPKIISEKLKILNQDETDKETK